MEADLDAAMAAIEVPVHAAVMRDDWLAPESSLRFLLSKLPRSPVERITMDAATLGAKADHFAWIRTPEAVAAFLAQVGATHPTRGLRARGVHRFRSEEHTSELQSLMRT